MNEYDIKLIQDKETIKGLVEALVWEKEELSRVSKMVNVVSPWEGVSDIKKLLWIDVTLEWAKGYIK